MGEPNRSEVPEDGAASAPANETPLATEAGSLEAQLEESRAEAARYKEDWLRAKAETENVRRRGQDDVAKAHKFGIESFASALLGVKDALEAALAVENNTVESCREGVDLTARQLDAVFGRFALSKIAPAVGERFDPHQHQAISQVESDQEPNTVTAVLQSGYRLHDRILRPALVTVSKARDSAG